MNLDNNAYGIRLIKLLAVPLTLIAAILLVLLGFEAWVRIYRPQSFSVKLSSQDFDRDTALPLKPSIEKGFTTGEYSVGGETNHFGFHDVEHSMGPHPGIYRIVILGDSFAEVEQFPIKDTWFKRLEAELETRLNRKIEIINLGIKGAGTGWELLILEKLGMRYEPDIVLLAFHLGSDFFNNHPRLEHKFEKPFFKIFRGKVFWVDKKETEILVRGVWLPLWRISHLYRYLHRNLYRIDKSFRIMRNGMPIFFEQYLTNPPAEWNESENYTEFYLNKILSLAQKNKSLLVVVGVPDKCQIDNGWWYKLKKKWPVMLDKKWDMDGPTKRLTKILKKLKIPFIDMVPIFRGRASSEERLYFKKDIHWNLRGNMLAAKAISEHIAEFIK